MPGIVDMIMPLVPRQADVAEGITHFADSIQRDNRTEAEVALHREQTAAQTAMQEKRIAAANAQAHEAIQAAKEKQAAEFSQKRQEQRAAAVKDFTDSVLAGDPARLEASAPYLSAHGISLEQGYENAAPTDVSTASTNAPISAMGGPGADALASVDQALASPGPGGPEAPQGAAPAPAGRHVIKLRTKEGEDLGNIDVTAIGEQRAAALKPVLDRLMAGAAPRDRSAYQQQISAAQQSPAMLAMGAPKLVESINKGAQPVLHEAHADYRAEIAPRPPVAGAGFAPEIAGKLDIIRSRHVQKAMQGNDIPGLNKSLAALGKAESMFNLDGTLKTGVAGGEGFEGQIRAAVGGRFGPEMLHAVYERAGLSGKAEQAFNYMFKGGHLPAQFVGDALKVVHALHGEISDRKKDVAKQVERDVKANPSIPMLGITPDQQAKIARDTGIQAAALTQEEVDDLESDPPPEDDNAQP
jgi:hypothetical protein